MTDDGGRRPLRSFVSELAKGKRIVRFTVRMTEEERDDLEEEAEKEGLNLSAFIRRLLKVRTAWGKRRKATADDAPPSSGANK